MALPPTIPTSFVPHTTTAVQRRYTFDFIGIFNVAAYLIFFITLGFAAGVFFYAQLLEGQLKSADARLAAEQKKIDSTIAQNFVRLDNRLTSATTLLNSHAALSNFFTALGAILPNTVRFSTLRVGVADGGRVTIDGTGVAKNFNALAAASASFASDGRIKDAIFSRLSVNKDNSVSFSISAMVDPKFVLFTGGESAPSVMVSTTTSSTEL